MSIRHRLRRALIPALGGCVGALGALAWVTAGDRGAPPRDRTILVRYDPPAASEDAGRLEHGGAPDFEVQIVPDEVDTAGGRERIAYHGEIVSRRGEKAGVAWTMMLVDDLGRIVQTLDRSADTFTGESPVFTGSRWISAPDGFYTLRVRAAIAGAQHSNTYEAVQHLAIRNGRVREMDAGDWHRKSRDGLAFSATGEGGAP